MLFNIPFYVQEKNECGPVSLLMVLEYLGKKEDKARIKSAVDSDASGVTWTPGLAKVAAELGFKAEFYTKHFGSDPENFELDFYQTQTDGLESTQSKLKKIHQECKELGVVLEERTFSMKEILSKINENCIAIILLDWGKINGKNKYAGHFVPIVGYDEKNVYVHQQGPKDPTPNFAIERSLFDEARKAKGTDEDIVFIHRKK